MAARGISNNVGFLQSPSTTHYTIGKWAVLFRGTIMEGATTYILWFFSRQPQAHPFLLLDFRNHLLDLPRRWMERRWAGGSGFRPPRRWWAERKELGRLLYCLPKPWLSNQWSWWAAQAFMCEAEPVAYSPPFSIYTWGPGGSDTHSSIPHENVLFTHNKCTPHLTIMAHFIIIPISLHPSIYVLLPPKRAKTHKIKHQLSS